MDVDEAAPKPTELVVSARDRAADWVYGVVAKRTYTALEDGTCVVARNQIPLVGELVSDPEHAEAILADSDMWPDKPATDVVVCGHTYNFDGRSRWQAEVSIRGRGRQIQACGERRCTIATTGRIHFSEPSVIERVPLSYRYAYGGCDRWAEEVAGVGELEPVLPFLSAAQIEPAKSASSPWRYPRNPTGRGFLVEDRPEALEQLELPQLEDPRDLLTPDRLILHDPALWPLQPLPASLDWLAPEFFPRLGWFGAVPEWDPDDIGQHIMAAPELRFGYAEPALFEDGELPDKFDHRALNGASLGLRFPDLSGNERISLLNLHPQLPHWVVKLPGERPSMAIDDRSGGLTRLAPRLSTVLIEPDAWRVTLVWMGLAKARRSYLEAECERMVFDLRW